MYCKIVNSLYVKANGEIPCWCAVGEEIILHHATKETDFIKFVLFGDKYNYIRDSLKGNKPPWHVCDSCFFLEKETPFFAEIVDKKLVKTIQIEPSYLCPLDCCACFPPKNERKKVKAPPHNMPLEMVTKVIDDIHNSGFTVEYFDFQGRGEPLVNKDVWNMVAYAREHFPQSFIKIVTNGNFVYKSGSVHTGLTELEVSVDGCYQDTYGIYRRGGNIEMAFKFMEDFVREKEKYKINTKVTWKYILFGHNDSDQELIDAQKKALDLGIDVLLFQTTPVLSGCKYSRFINKNMPDFPKIDLGGFSLMVVPPNENPMNEFLENIRKNETVSSLLIERNHLKRKQ